MLYGSDVKEVFGLSPKGPTKDAVGIEIEMELTNPITEPWMANGWTIKGDGSLRNHGYEFVSNPTSMKDLPNLLGEWDNALNSKMLSSRIEDCPRASVHVHVNVRDYTYNQLMNIVVAYILLEGALVAYCGKYRFGNLFALRIPEASSNFRALVAKVKDYAPFKFNSDHRYGALNLCSVSRFGTIEFRSLGSVYNPKDIDLWVSGLRYMVDHAATHYKKPPDVYARYADVDRRTFLEEFLGPLAGPLMSRVHDIDSLFEDGEEYAIRLLASHPDNWVYDKDFRDNKEFQKACKDNYGYNKKQILSLGAGSARQILREGRDRAVEVDPSGADFTDWVPAVDESEAPRASPRDPVNSANSVITWVGELPSSAFTSSLNYDTYIAYMGTNTEQQARRLVWDAGYLRTEWVQRYVSRLPNNQSSRRSGAVRFETLAQAVAGNTFAGNATTPLNTELRPWRIPTPPASPPDWAMDELSGDVDEDGNPI